MVSNDPVVVGRQNQPSFFTDRLSKEVRIGLLIIILFTVTILAFNALTVEEGLPLEAPTEQGASSYQICKLSSLLVQYGPPFVGIFNVDYQPTRQEKEKQAQAQDQGGRFDAWLQHP